MVTRRWNIGVSYTKLIGNMIDAGIKKRGNGE